MEKEEEYWFHTLMVNLGERTTTFVKINYICDECGQTFKQQKHLQNPSKLEGLFRTLITEGKKLVGVVVRQDSTLPQYICRNCHAQFYKCWTILKNLIQKVNTSPVAAVQHGQKASRCVAANETSPLSNSVSDDFKQMLNDGFLVASPQGLQILLTWAHHHGSSCGSQPHVQSVLTAEYRGVVGAAWGCPEGHSYILDIYSNRSVVLNEGQCPSSRNKDLMEEVLDGSIAATHLLAFCPCYQQRIHLQERL
ncbi:zinc finger protein 276-like [Leucoraja erinacea]|uniref:zinc finger protein 276-like n=1 Tax=Leucoraja erinaceus TaxID=7782 RepID=UPI002456148A|nr:zinc finger protein 276-like [Leucoraja erinacea]